MILYFIIWLDEEPANCVRDSASYLDASPVREHARGNWLSILERLAPELEPALQRVGRHVACPVHGGRDGFRLFHDAPVTGGAVCNTCGFFPDGFALLMWLHGWRFPEALHAVATGLYILAPMRRTPRSKPSTTWRKVAINRVWDSTLDPNDPRAEPLQLYLANRGLGGCHLDASTIRYHPQLAYWENGRQQGAYPAIVARVTSPSGELVTLHRTYLSHDGLKAPVLAPKKLMPYPEGLRLAGSAIRLAVAHRTLNLAEGIETALAVQIMTGEATWVATSAVLMERFQPPAEVSELTIWADLDKSGRGEHAAEVLASRLPDLDVSIRLPTVPIPAGSKGIDWADVLTG